MCMLCYRKHYYFLLNHFILPESDKAVIIGIAIKNCSHACPIFTFGKPTMSIIILGSSVKLVLIFKNNSNIIMFIQRLH